MQSFSLSEQCSLPILLIFLRNQHRIKFVFAYGVSTSRPRNSPVYLPCLLAGRFRLPHTHTPLTKLAGN